MTPWDRVLTPEQLAQRASAVLDVIAGRIDGIGWECIERNHQRGLTRAWNAMQLDLMTVKGMAQPTPEQRERWGGNEVPF